MLKKLTLSHSFCPFRKPGYHALPPLSHTGSVPVCCPLNRCSSCSLMPVPWVTDWYSLDRTLSSAASSSYWVGGFWPEASLTILCCKEGVWRVDGSFLTWSCINRCSCWRCSANFQWYFSRFSWTAECLTMNILFTGSCCGCSRNVAAFKDRWV